MQLREQNKETRKGDSLNLIRNSKKIKRKRKKMIYLKRRQKNATID